jgi:hypothetical protein
MSCHYEWMPEGVHSFYFSPDGRSGLDDFFARLTEILANAPAHTRRLRYLVDVSDAGEGEAPFHELVRRFRELEIALPQRPPGRTALIVANSRLLSLANALIATLAPQKDRTRFFSPERREAALEWVLRDD